MSPEACAPATTGWLASVQRPSMRPTARDLSQVARSAQSMRYRPRRLPPASRRLLEPADRNEVVSGLLQRGETPGQRRAIGELLLAQPSGEAPRREGAVRDFLGAWSEDDAGAALEWMLEHRDALAPEVLETSLATAGYNDPVGALDLVERLTGDGRGRLIAGIAAGLARRDADQALAWLEQFDGEAGFADGMGMLAAEVARTDQRAASRLLPRIADASNAAESLTTDETVTRTLCGSLRWRRFPSIAASRHGSWRGCGTPGNIGGPSSCCAPGGRQPIPRRRRRGPSASSRASVVSHRLHSAFGANASISAGITKSSCPLRNRTGTPAHQAFTYVAAPATAR